MVAMDVDGGGIAFTRSGVVCDTKDMSPETIDHLVKMHNDWKADQKIKRVERNERLMGYLMQPIEYMKAVVNKYFK